jgi:hypothetical protein
MATTPPSPTDYRWLLPLVLALLSLTISAFAGYNRNDRETIQRMSTVEAHLADDRKNMDEIKIAVRQTNDKLTEVLILLSTKH